MTSLPPAHPASGQPPAAPGATSTRRPPPEECPVLQGASQASALSSDLLRALRKIRRDLKQCPNCPVYEECATLKDLQGRMNNVILEVLEEWNLLPVEQSPLSGARPPRPLQGG